MSEISRGTTRLIDGPFLVICQLPRLEKAFDDGAEAFKVFDAEVLLEHCVTTCRVGCLLYRTAKLTGPPPIASACNSNQTGGSGPAFSSSASPHSIPMPTLTST